MSSPSPCYQRLLDDHHDTCEQLKTLKALVDSQTQWTQLQMGISALSEFLKRHYALEEQGLFPVLNMYRTMTLLEVEHDALMDLEVELLRLASEDEPFSERFISTFNAWYDQLLAHIRQENDGIFPKVDQWLEPEEKALVARKIEELSKASPPPRLGRPEPSVSLGKLQGHGSGPVDYHALFEQDHVRIQEILLHPGASLKRHWAPETQFLTVLSGSGVLETDSAKQSLLPGDTAQITPRTYFSIHAKTDVQILMVKVWAKPHFIRVP